MTISLICLCIGASLMDAHAQTFRHKNREVSEMLTAQQIKALGGVFPTMTVRQDKWDEMVALGSAWGDRLKFKSLHTFVKLKVDHDYLKKISNKYTILVAYKLVGYASMADTTASTTIFDTLSVSYHPDSLAAYQDNHFNKYSKFHKVQVTITGIYKIEDALSPPVLIDFSGSSTYKDLNFNFEVAIVVQPYHKRVKNGTAYIDAYPGTVALTTAATHVPDTDYLTLRWNYPSNTITNPIEMTPANYELEWVYVDNYRVTLETSGTTVTEKTTAQLDYDFKNNATRVTLDSNYYRIPLVYQKGYLVYRVRVVRPDSVYYRHSLYGPWSVAANTAKLNTIAANNYFKITNAHLNDSLNWQYTISFAEQGKYKQVMSYFDGLLKNRQSITRFNSDPDYLIATEQIYDYEGRPSISLLPSPVPTNGKFRMVRNLSQNALTSTPYKAFDFDRISLAACPDEPVLNPLGNLSGAHRYYSGLNADTTGKNRYIPHAGGYPLVQTVYSPGFDDRVFKQGGAGAELQLSKNHFSKNNYVAGDQYDLNRLFGINIGYSGFYRKTVSKDPNGQYSMTVTDYEGRTVASSMIGLLDTLHHAITKNRNVPESSLFYEDHIAGTTQSYIGNKITLNKTFFNDVDGNSSAQYLTHFAPFPTFCSGKFLSVKFDYNYQIADECGDLIVEKEGILGVNGVMSSGATLSATGDIVPFFMKQGEHYLHKELSFDPYAVNTVVDEFLALPTSENCVLNETYFIKQAVLSKSYPCPPPSTSNPCEERKLEMMEQLWPNQDSMYTKRKYGVYHETGGGFPSLYGNDNSIFTIYISGTGFTDSLVDPTQPGGIDTTLITGFSYKYRYQDPCVNLPASVTKDGVVYTNLKELPPATFAYIFNDAIAEALLPLHPEYCSLLECVNDTYPELLRSIPDGVTAAAINLFNIADVINADPLRSAMVSSGLYPNVMDTLSYFKVPRRPVDSFPLAMAYCGNLMDEAYNECVTNIYKTQIDSRVFINDFVKNAFYKNFVDAYIDNRAPYRFNLSPVFESSMPGCEQCIDIRMRLVPLPIFMDAYTAEVGLETYIEETSTLGEVTLGSDFGMGIVTGLATITDEDSLIAYYDSATALYTTFTSALCEGAVDNIMGNLVNCGNASVLLAIKNDLLALCASGAVLNGNYSPEQIRKVLIDNSATVDDLCNPYLVNYDYLLSTYAVPNRLIACKSNTYYGHASDLFNSTVGTSLRNLGTSYAVTLNPARAFDSEIIAGLGAGPYTVVSAYNSSTNLYTVSVKKGTSTVKFQIQASEGGYCSTPFASGTGHSVEIMCIKDAEAASGQVFTSTVDGLIVKHVFGIKITRTEAGSQRVCILPGWSSGVQFNTEGNNTIQSCIPCTQMKGIFKNFMDTMTTYEVKGVDHPLYPKMLKNYANSILKKSYTATDYVNFVESCAFADSMRLPLYVGYAQARSTVVTGLNTLLANLRAIDADVEIGPVIFNHTGTTKILSVDFNYIPFSKLRIYKNYLQTYTASGVTITTNARMWTAADNMGRIYLPPSSTFVPDASIFAGSAAPFTFTFGGAQNMNIGSSATLNFRVYNAIAPAAATPADVSRNTFLLQQYLYENGIAAFYYNNFESGVNEEYFTPEKKAYLSYVYSMLGAAPHTVLDSIQAQKLISNIAEFSDRVVSYGHPMAPNDLNNLYYAKTSELATAGFTRLQGLITQVTNYFQSTTSRKTVFFDGANTRNIAAGNVLTGFRCGDGNFWYRHFGANDTLYNIYIKTPPYLNLNQLKNFQVTSVTPNLGTEDSRSFILKMNSTTLPGLNLQVEGYVDFVVGKNKVLNNVLLANALLEPVSLVDTVDNCERRIVKNAIIEGKVQYEIYIDSIRRQLRSDFLAHLMGGSITEKLFVGYNNQRFNYTLYEYDRAGNLMKTIPPAGVRMLATPASDTLGLVDWARLENVNPNYLLPKHRKISQYAYNTINQVEAQSTPDGGSTQFFYDAAGRVIFSQNSNQRDLGNLTYTLYDAQSRIVETGESKLACAYFVPFAGSSPAPGGCGYYDPGTGMTSPFPPVVTNLKHITHQDVTSFVRSKTRYEVVHTTYDKEAVNLSLTAGLSTQDNLRKRVSCIKYLTHVLPANTAFTGYEYAMHFSYDIAGNVKTLTRDYPGWQSYKQRYKRIDYDYDVISGKVNLLSYNRGFPDQFYQKYQYDDDNRITSVATSSDAYIWKTDARYDYYQHGPLARTSMGQHEVQGVDYVYTIQGWLKAVNGDFLDTAKDIGRDGTYHNLHASDAAAFTIDYFKGDYRSITGAKIASIESGSKNLYNGNIIRTSSSILPFQDTNLVAGYIYDQLNRLIKSEYATIKPDGTLTASQLYYNDYTYDPDGNIMELTRHGNNMANLQMDKMNYYYQDPNSNNKLVNITDNAPDVYSNDIKKFTATAPVRYKYDKIGNLISDEVTGNDNIIWSIYNKVRFANNSADSRHLSFYYDGAGQRHRKVSTKFTPMQDQFIQGEYYVRDAQGNILAVYKNEYKSEKYEMAAALIDTLEMMTTAGLVIDSVIYPYFGGSEAFSDAIIAAVDSDAVWSAAYMDTVSLATLLGSRTVQHKLISQTIDSMQLLTALSLYAAEGIDADPLGHQSIIARALLDYFDSSVHQDHYAKKEFWDVLLDPGTTIHAGLAGLLCEHAPDVLSQAMNGWSLPVSSDCNANQETLAAFFAKSYNNLLGFIIQVNKVGAASYPAQYKNFLTHYLADDTYFGRDNAYQWMLNAAPTLTRKVAAEQGMAVDHADPAAMLQTLFDTLHTASRRMAFMNDFMQEGIENQAYKTEFEKYITAVSAQPATLVSNAGRKQTLQYLCTYAPALSLQAQKELLGGIIAYADCTSFADSFAMVLEADAKMRDAYTGILAALSTEYATEFGNVVDRVCADTAIMTTAFYNGNGGQMRSILHRAILQQEMTEDMIAFFTGWAESRSFIDKVIDRRQLLQSVYEADGSNFLKSYREGSSTGLAGIKSAAGAAAVSELDEVEPMLQSLQEEVPGLHAKDMLAALKKSNHYDRFYLAEHHIYGSSRLGIKTYPSSQYYVYTDMENNGVIDTITLVSRKPWYSLEYNDGISSLVTAPYGMTDVSNYSVQHQIGNKQYELANHLGNVLATVSDLKYPVYYKGATDSLLHHYTAALPAAYDYYPFGMLMPGRYVSDTTADCQTITQTRWFTTYVDSCYTTPWLTTGPWITRLGSATITPSGPGVSISLADPASAVTYAMTVVPEAENTLTLHTGAVSNPARVSIVELVSGQEVVLSEQLLQVANQGSLSFSITPSTPSVGIRIRWHTLPATVAVSTICVKVPQMQSETYLVDVCDETGDKYRFGYNGQEKVNEMAGIGNHNTAEFWEYDTRVARRWNVDPVVKEYESSYLVFGGNPIFAIDPEGNDTTSANSAIQDPQENGYSEAPGGGSLVPTFKGREKPQRREGLVFVEETPEVLAIGEFIFNATPILGPINMIQQQFTGESMTGVKVEPANSSIEMVFPTIGRVPNPSNLRASSIQSEGNVIREAEKLSDKIGKNSVTIKTVNGQKRYDLKGAGHKHKPSQIDIKTPHKIGYTEHYRKILDKHGKQVRSGPGKMKIDKNPTTMNKQDIRILKNYLKSLNR